MLAQLRLLAGWLEQTTFDWEFAGSNPSYSSLFLPFNRKDWKAKRAEPS